MDMGNLAPAIVGLFGDILTFSGGVILAYDAVHQERQYQQIRDWAATLTSPELITLRVAMNGVAITDKEDVERAFIRHSSKRALNGLRVLVAGFALLLCSRVIEIAIQASH